MRLKIDHHTRYSFSEPQLRLVQMLRLTPEDSDAQSVIDWRIDVDRDARLREGRDGFGNRVTMLYADGPIDAIEIAVSGEVLTTEVHGVVAGASELLPPELFLRTTERTQASDALTALVSRAMRDREPIAALHAANAALCERLTIRDEPVDAGRTAAEAIEADSVSPRDAAHLLIAGLRACDVPARYVWGYRATEGDALAAPHPWCEAWVEGLGWIGFDPSCGLCPGEHYARVAIGLDSAGAAPVAGSRLGEGRERLAVESGGGD